MPPSSDTRVRIFSKPPPSGPRLPTVTDVAGVTLRTAGVTAMTVTRYVASDEPLSEPRL